MSIHPPLLHNARRLVEAEAHVDEPAFGRIQQAGSGCGVARHDRRIRMIEVVAVAGGNQREHRMERGNELFTGRSPAAVMRDLHDQRIAVRAQSLGNRAFDR